VARLMGDVKADMVYCDPPYGMHLNTDFSSMRQGKVYRPIAGDDQPYDPAHIFETFGACREIVLWGADYYAERIPERNAESWFVWDKANGGDAPNEDYDTMFGSNFELAWSKTRHKRALIRILWKGFFGLSQEDTKRRVHPTQKPTELARWFFDRFTKKEACVVDLFLGSGTSLVGAEQTARRCFAIELDPVYCQIAIDRWEAFVGNGAKAVKVGEVHA
jgi:DNA modification methylase